MSDLVGNPEDRFSRVAAHDDGSENDTGFISIKVYNVPGNSFSDMSERSHRFLGI